jgi:hypothetical protein
MNNLLTHMHILWPSSTCFLGKHVLQANTQKQVEIHKIKKKAQCRIHILGMLKGEKKQKPNNSKHLYWNTTTVEAQAQPGTNPAKAVVRWAH